MTMLWGRSGGTPKPREMKLSTRILLLVLGVALTTSALVIWVLAMSG